MATRKARFRFVMALAVVPFIAPLVSGQLAHAVARDTSTMKIVVDGVSADVLGHGNGGGGGPAFAEATEDKMLFGLGDQATDAEIAAGSDKAVGARRYMSTKKNRGFFFGVPQGPIQMVSCTGGTEKKPYRVAQLTLSNLTIDTSTQTLWVFHDASIKIDKTNATSSGSPRWATPANASDNASSRTAALDTACDGSAIVTPLTTGVTAAEDSAYLRKQTNGSLTKGLKLSYTGSISTFSFKVLIPAFFDGQDSKNITAMGFLVGPKTQAATATDIGLSTNYAIDTYIYSDPFFAESSMVLSSCTGSESATAAPCAVAANTGFVGNDFSGSVLSANDYSLEMMGMGTTQGTDVSSFLRVSMRRSTPATGANAEKGYKIPDGTVAKVQLSLPSSGRSLGVDFAANDYAKSSGQTKLLINPNGDAASNAWSMETAGVRKLVTVIGTVKTTSSVVNAQSWLETCQATFSTTFTATGCGSEAELAAKEVAVIDATFARFMLQYASRFGDDMTGSMVSTNAQGVAFGPKTITGEAFQFGVAGPSAKEDGSLRATDGFWYVCLPEKFIVNKWKSTVEESLTDSKATRDGVDLGKTYATEVLNLASSNCGPTKKGLLASVSAFHYSEPVFTIEKKTATKVVLVPTVKINKATTAKSIATYLNMTIASGSKLSLKVAPASARYCKVAGVTVKGVKKGSCKVTVTVTPKKGKAVSRSKTLLVS